MTFAFILILIIFLPSVIRTSDPFGYDWWITSNGGMSRWSFKQDSLEIDTQSPKLMWSSTVASQQSLMGQPVVYKNRVIVVDAGYFDPCTVTVFDEVTGDLISNTTLTTVESGGPASISHFEDQILVQVNGQDSGIQVYSLEFDSLDINWIQSARSQWDDYYYGVPSSEFTQMMYVPGGYYCGELYGFSMVLDDPKQIFDTNLYSSGAGSSTWAPSVVSDENGRVRVFWNSQAGEGSDSAVGEIDAYSGENLWDITLNSNWEGYDTEWMSVPVGDYLIATNWTTGPNPVVIDTFEQKILWSDACEGSKSSIGIGDKTFATDGKLIYMTCQHGVYTWELVTGKRGPWYNLGNFTNTCSGPPIVLLSHILVTCESQILIFDTGSRSVVATIAIDSKLSPSAGYNLAYHGGWLFISHEKGTVQAWQLTSK